MRVFAPLFFFSTALASPLIFAQPTTTSSQAAASCESLGALASYVERCGGKAPAANAPGAYAAEVTEWTTSFLNCAKSSAPSFDDKVSDAATIAVGLSGYCQSKIYKPEGRLSPKDSDHIVERVKPTVIGIVLQNRVSSHKAKVTFE